MKKRGMRKVLFTIACVMLFAIAGGRQVFAQGENLTLQEMQRAVSVSETASGSHASVGWTADSKDSKNDKPELGTAWYGLQFV